MTNKLNINVDRLEITYTAGEELKEYLSDKNTEEFEFDSFSLRRTPSRQYENEFAIVGKGYDEEKGVCDRNYGYLHFGSPNPNRPNIYVVFENDILYDESTLASRFWIEDVLGLEFLQISKLDVAVDFSFNIIRKFYQLYKNPNYSLIINGVKRDSVDEVIHEVVHIAGNTTRKRPLSNPSPVIKNSNGTLALKAYNKTKEIYEESHKDYIIQAAGFKRLYRFEISCDNHKEVKKTLDRIGLSELELYKNLSDESVLISVFASMIDRLIRVDEKRNRYSLFEILLDGVE